MSEHEEPLDVLSSNAARVVLGLDEPTANAPSHTQARLIALKAKTADENASEIDVSASVVAIGNAALNAFLQVNVTGPPPKRDLEELVPPRALLPGLSGTHEDVHRKLTAWLSIDGEAVYQKIPHIQLLVLAKLLVGGDHSSFACTSDPAYTRELLLANLRVDTWHQRLLGQPAPSLQHTIYDTLQKLEDVIANDELESDPDDRCAFLIEKAAIHILHGFDMKARGCLQEATRIHHFDFVLTGRLGKRTKFQINETSQLVVLAKSHEWSPSFKDRFPESDQMQSESVKPRNIDLQDDTLLDAIAFKDDAASALGVGDNEKLPQSLSGMNPGDQPILNPLDSIILLATASSVTNMSPVDGLTREETLPYAERVLSGGSSNWQIYTQALLIRSRIEGYRTRTIERGVLQLQAVVDQVIAETTSTRATPEDGEKPATTFLPRAKASESASTLERLRYIHQLASPPRWKLEAELAERWVSLGGLRTALEIYERLEMWAEVALCWASSGQEDKARQVVRDQLYICNEGGTDDTAIERDPLPVDAPRLFCILGDIDMSIPAYERAWEISNHGYARAQRSLGKVYVAKRSLDQADAAYVRSLRVKPQDHPTWFALGCVRLQTENWRGAVEAFGRAVQIEDSDAESWSNLAVSLLRLPEEGGEQKNTRGAFVAMKRATALKRDNSKLWQNLLAVAIQLSPPPHAEIVMTQSRLIELLGTSQGESMIDIPVVEALLSHVIEIDANTTDPQDSHNAHRHLRRSVIDLITKQIAPLVTSSRPLWVLIAKLNIHLKRPSAALSTYEKAWRSCLNQPGWDSNSSLWGEVSEATIDLIDAYESLGEQNRESGLGEGKPVCKDWKFKARSALRSVLARAKEAWESDDRFETLQARLNELKGA